MSDTQHGKYTSAGHEKMEHHDHEAPFLAISKEKRTACYMQSTGKGICFAHGPYENADLSMYCPKWPACITDPQKPEYVAVSHEQVNSELSRLRQELAEVLELLNKYRTAVGRLNSSASDDSELLNSLAIQPIAAASETEGLRQPAMTQLEHFEKWLDGVYQRNPAGLAAEFVSNARIAHEAGWRGREKELSGLRQELADCRSQASALAEALEEIEARTKLPDGHQFHEPLRKIETIRLRVGSALASYRKSKKEDK
jgi:hypothetical protein